MLATLVIILSILTTMVIVTAPILLNAMHGQTKKKVIEATKSSEDIISVLEASELDIPQYELVHSAERKAIDSFLLKTNGELDYGASLINPDCVECKGLRYNAGWNVYRLIREQSGWCFNCSITYKNMLNGHSSAAISEKKKKYQEELNAAKNYSAPLILENGMTVVPISAPSEKKYRVTIKSGAIIYTDKIKDSKFGLVEIDDLRCLYENQIIEVMDVKTGSRVGIKSAPSDYFQEYKVKVTANDLNVRSSPGIAKINILKTVSRGRILKVIDKQGDWLKVEGGVWVYGKYTERVSDTTSSAPGSFKIGDKVQALRLTKAYLRANTDQFKSTVGQGYRGIVKDIYGDRIKFAVYWYDMKDFEKVLPSAPQPAVESIKPTDSESAIKIYNLSAGSALSPIIDPNTKKYLGGVVVRAPFDGIATVQIANRELNPIRLVVRSSKGRSYTYGVFSLSDDLGAALHNSFNDVGTIKVKKGDYLGVAEG